MRTAKINTEEMADGKALKSCPWCGDAPQASELDWGGVSIRCNNSGCNVRPETGWCDSAGDALAMWNTREA